MGYSCEIEKRKIYILSKIEKYLNSKYNIVIVVKMEEEKVVLKVRRAAISQVTSSIRIALETLSGSPAGTLILRVPQDSKIAQLAMNAKEVEIR